MKKKLLALSLTLALIIASAVPAAAAFTTSWRLEDAGMTVALPSDWEVLTPDMDADDIAYTTLSQEFYAGVLEWITDDEIYMYAIEPDSLLSLIIFVDEYEDGVDYRTASDGFMKTLVEGYNEGEYERLRNYNAYIREVEGLRYIWSEYTSSANDDYFLLTELVLNGVYYFARIDSLEPLTDNNRNLMCSVLEGTSYDAISYSGRYHDVETGCRFTAPEGWTVKENENAWNGKSRVTLVSPSGEMSVYFGSEPVEGGTMADFTPADIESAFARRARRPPLPTCSPMRSFRAIRSKQRRK